MDKETSLKFTLGDANNDGKVDIKATLTIFGIKVPFEPSINLGFGAAMTFIGDLFHRHGQGGTAR